MNYELGIFGYTEIHGDLQRCTEGWVSAFGGVIGEGCELRVAGWPLDPSTAFRVTLCERLL